MRSLPLAALAATGLAAVVIPAEAEARCGVAQTKASYETPDLQLRPSKGRLVGCIRALGRDRVLGYANNDDETFADEILGHRWLVSHTAYVGGGESVGGRSVGVDDLRTGKSVEVEVRDSDGESTADAIGVPGGLLVSDGTGVSLRKIGGGKRVLAPANVVTGIGYSGTTVYMRTNAGVVAVDVGADIPTAAGTARTAPKARKIGRCKPKANAKLVRTDGDFIFTRTSAGIYQCKRKVGSQRLVAKKPRVFADFTGYAVTFARPGFVGMWNIETEERSELASTGPALFIGRSLVATPVTGLVSQQYDGKPKILDAGPVTKVGRGVASENAGDVNDLVFWTRADGTAAVTDLT